MIHLLALLGVVTISFSAVFVRLAAVSPVTAAFFRAAYAVPVLAGLWLSSRSRDSRPLGARVVAGLSGLMLAVDLVFWHGSIALVGAGLATVIANVQVVFVALLGWALHRERPTPRTLVVVTVVLVGIALTSGLGRHDAYGAAPVRGVLLAVLAGAAYCGYLLTFRASNRLLVPAAGPLLDASLGVAIGALVCAPLDPGFTLVPFWPAHGWLVSLALTAQVLGWLLIATALPRLPAIETSILLVVQPVFTLVWGVMIFAEHLSAVQWGGAALVLAGVTLMSRQASVSTPPGGAPAAAVVG